MSRVLHLLKGHETELPVRGLLTPGAHAQKLIRLREKWVLGCQKIRGARKKWSWKKEGDPIRRRWSWWLEERSWKWGRSWISGSCEEMEARGCAMATGWWCLRWAMMSSHAAAIDPNFCLSIPGQQPPPCRDGRYGWRECVKGKQVVAKALILLVLKQTPKSNSQLLCLACDILKVLSAKVLPQLMSRKSSEVEPWFYLLLSCVKTTSRGFFFLRCLLSKYVFRIVHSSDSFIFRTV